MQIIHNKGERKIVIKGLPRQIPNCLKDNDVEDIEISINYVKGSNDSRILTKAIILDNFIIPSIVSALEKTIGKTP